MLVSQLTWSHTVENETLPRRITLEGFLPWIEKTNIMTGEDVQPARKITFLARSIEPDGDYFDPLPPVKLPNLSVIDRRFPDVGKYIVISHADPTNGWPVRANISNPSMGYKNAEARARQIALNNNLVVQTNLKLKKVIVAAILGINLLVFFAVWLSHCKQKQQKQQTENNI